MEYAFRTLLMGKKEAFMLCNKPVGVLVVEDNENEQASIVEVLRSAIPDVQVFTFGTGTEALNFLFSRGDWLGRVGTTPLSLIMLDLDLPGKDGFSILGQIRSLDTEDALRLTPVVIFTNSRNAADVTRGYCCGANSYIIKPVSFPQFQVIVTNLAQYWITYNIRSF